MSTTPTREELIAMAGLTYGRRHEVSYRAGLVMQVLGAALAAVLYPLESPFFTVGIIIFEAGVLLSAVYLLAWMHSIKIFLLGSVISGLAVQVAGMYFAPEHYAASMIIVGIGLVCIGAGGMVGKEAYYFGYREGWALMIAGFPVMVLVNLLGKENRIFNALGFSIVFLLLLSLAGRKLKQRLLSALT